MSKNNYIDSTKAILSSKIGYRSIGRNTDTRTLISSFLPQYPSGNSLLLLSFPSENIKNILFVLSILNSFTYEWQLRNRLGGTNLNWFFFEETALFPKSFLNCVNIAEIALMLVCTIIKNSSEWTDKSFKLEQLKSEKSWYQLWAITPYERLRLRCILDAVIAELYSLEIEDFAWILKECDYPRAQINDKTFARTLDTKGFWRVDKEKYPEMRHTVLSLVAFHELKRIGLDNFLNLNNGEGWMLPDTLTLADYNLGHDERANQPQPVTSPFTLEEWANLETPVNAPLNYRQRYYPWQLAKTPEESWLECEKHADNLTKLLGNNSVSKEKDKTMTTQTKITENQQLDLFASTDVPVLSDEAMSRESIYTREDEQL